MEGLSLLILGRWGEINALMLALMKPQQQFFQRSSQIGINVRVFPSRSLQIHESSPLDLASEEPERLSCLQRLLQLGADVNAADKNGGCAPPGASAESRELLLGAFLGGALFFYLSSPTAGKTALLHALASSDGVQIHNTESIRLLLEGGEDELPSAHKTSPG